MRSHVSFAISSNRTVLNDSKSHIRTFTYVMSLIENGFFSGGLKYFDGCAMKKTVIFE